MVLDPALLASLAQDTAAAVNWLTGVKTPADRLEVVLRVFESLNERQPDRAAGLFAASATYDDPTIGPPVVGPERVRASLTRLVTQLAAESRTFVIDRVTGGKFNVIVEWHTTPIDRRRGVHVAELNEAAKITRLTVYPRTT